MAQGNTPPRPPRPGQRPAPAGPPSRRSHSGIEVDDDANDYGVTATVLLSRSGMGMMQHKKAEEAPPAPDNLVYSVASEADDIGCPKCKERFEISPEFYGAVAECPECSCEFVIKPPGTPPYRPPQKRPQGRQPQGRPPQGRNPPPAGRRPPPQRSAPPGPKPAPKPAAKQAPPTPPPAVAEPPAPAPAPAPPARSNGLMIGLLVIGVVIALLLIAVIALLLFNK
ncbi:MAG: hypothetical protein ACI8W8_000423 [Rhodothermales bacterium]|jgi:hypothetical protein